MNSGFLLRHYERIADAPDAITRLRLFILDLAVHGKLIMQNPSEHVAKTYAGGQTAETLPKNWRQLNFGQFCDIEGGNQPPKSQFINEPRKGYVQLFQIRDLGERPVPTYIPLDSTSRFCKQGEILIGRYGASIGKVFWAKDGAYNVAMAKFVWPADALVARFAFLLLKSKYLQGPLAHATRSAQAGFNKGDLSTINFPLPPIAEQHRIVAKVDELMALCDRLEAVRAEREAGRDRLAAATLARLNTPDPEQFQNHARFALSTLPALTTRPDQIKQLRQTILNLAVRGGFTAPTRCPLKPTKLGEVASLENGYAFKSEWFSKTGTRLLRNANVGHGTINWDDEVRLPDVQVAEYERFRLRAGDVVLTLDRPFIVTGTKVARIKENDLPALLLQRVGRFVLSKNLASDYLFLWINSPHFSEQIDPGRSNGVPHISSKQVEAALIFIPDIAEQYSIVAKVDELLSICDQLEQNLTTTDATRRRLLEALLADALVPATAKVLEAAE